MTASSQLIPSWQQKEWASLCNYIRQDRIPQALLITGTSGIDKQNLASQFATTLLCDNPQANNISCGKCHSCLLINANTHPDFVQIRPEDDKTSISINQIRHIVSDTHLKPQFDTYRVIIINPAETLTISAANGFLKCLEEPTERTIFILITDKPNKLPATIISRCQKLTITCPDKQSLKQWLTEQGIHDNQETLLSLMKTSIINMAQISDHELLKQRTECFNDWLMIAKHHSYPAIIADKWQKLPRTDLINWLISWLTDLIKCSYRINNELMCNQDFFAPLQKLAQQLDLTRLYRLYDQLLENRQQLGTQINFQIMLEETLVQWQQLNERN